MPLDLYYPIRGTGGLLYSGYSGNVVEFGCALEMSFTEDEVYGALLGCSEDKASGPDGFTMAFWQFAWDFVKEEVLKNNENGIMCKLDIDKAYNNVNWYFLLTIMQKMGFGDKWIGWIEWCISTASFSVLVNGTSKGFFQSSRRLRQGDPLSPCLFVIAMEVFSTFLKRVVDGGFMSGCKVKGRNEERVQISHLLFAYDTLVFCQVSQDQLIYLSWLLMWFKAVSGLRINLEKSELIPVGRVENIDDLTLKFGYRVGSLPSTYLGLPLGAPFKSISVWDGVEERFRGLGIKCVSILNKALISKWNWLFANKREVLWNQVIRGKYGEDRGGWCSREVREAHGIGLWKGIRMDWELGGARISFSVGNGKTVRFWRDRWCGDSPLCECFPSFFALSVEKEAWVANVWDPLAEGDWGG
ncbi:LINE-1 reverse transcriptase-like [Vitis vinifera]|uniref:LINE-1 reverse transcriptase-like n=1 Tax=Vitis vinifera TaxID=29760 RepID=A0A438CKV9_VITVI|nr:LINE-1 reverse transcriptase-like [Vitis vinifera]